MAAETNDSDKLMRDLKFCVIDLETTGGDHSKDRIIEIGLVKVENLSITGELTYLINPEIKIPDFVQKLTSISQEKLKNEKKIEEVIDEIVAFIGDSILVAHNAAFDVPFLNSVLSRIKKSKLENPSICTNLMTKYLIPEIMNSNLPYLGKLFGIPHKNAHRALEDAKVTAKVLCIYINLFIEKGIKKINHLYYPRKKFEFDTAHFKGDTPSEIIIKKIESTKTPFTMVFKGDKGVILNVLPLRSFHENKDLILKNLNVPFETLTIKMTGTFYKCLLELNYYFTRLPQDRQEEMLSYLKEKIPNDQKIDQLQQKYHDHFIIRRHLVPEQFVIHYIDTINPKSELIFRYPTHQKKLFQYINYNLKHIDKRKPNTGIHPKLKEVIFSFYNNETPSEEYFLFTGNQFKKNQYDLKNKLDDFVNTKRNEINFPIQHL